jgi:hypothetical protein
MVKGVCGRGAWARSLRWDHAAYGRGLIVSMGLACVAPVGYRTGIIKHRRTGRGVKQLSGGEPLRLFFSDTIPPYLPKSEVRPGAVCRSGVGLHYAIDYSNYAAPSAVLLPAPHKSSYSACFLRMRIFFKILLSLGKRRHFGCCCAYGFLLSPVHRDLRFGEPSISSTEVTTLLH